MYIFCFFFAQRSPVEPTGREDAVANLESCPIAATSAPLPLAHRCKIVGGATSRRFTTVWSGRRQQISAADRPELPSAWR